MCLKTSYQYPKSGLPVMSQVRAFIRVLDLISHSHCTEPGPGMGPGTMGYYILCCTVHTAMRQGQEPDPLFPIVLVPFPVQVLVPCSVNKPLEGWLRSQDWPPIKYDTTITWQTDPHPLSFSLFRISVFKYNSAAASSTRFPFIFPKAWLPRSNRSVQTKDWCAELFNVDNLRHSDPDIKQKWLVHTVDESYSLLHGPNWQFRKVIRNIDCE